MDDAELAARRSAGGKATVARRRARTEGLLVEAALKLTATGAKPTQAAVMGSLDEASRPSESTVHRHWPAVRAALSRAATAAVPRTPPEPAVVERDPAPPPQPDPENRLTPAQHCENLQHIFRDFIARGHTRAYLANLFEIPLADVVALLGPDSTLEGD